MDSGVGGEGRSRLSAAAELFSQGRFLAASKGVRSLSSPKLPPAIAPQAPVATTKAPHVLIADTNARTLEARAGSSSPPG